LEAELRATVTSPPHCRWSAEVDDDGKLRYTFFSPLVEAIAGQPAEFFAAGVQRWWSVLHPEDQRLWEGSLLRFRTGQPTDTEYRVLRPDATCRWVRESVQVNQQGTAQRSVRLDGVIRDITEWKHAEDRWRAAADRLTAFLDNGPFLAFLKDSEGRLVYHNACFAHLFGGGSSSLVGKTDTDLFPAEVASRFRQAEVAVLATRETSTMIENIGAPAAGPRRCLFIRFPVVSAGRSYLGGLGVDVTNWPPLGEVTWTDKPGSPE
jgi:PAS domain-containing protein